MRCDALLCMCGKLGGVCCEGLAAWWRCIGALWVMCCRHLVSLSFRCVGVAGANGLVTEFALGDAACVRCFCSLASFRVICILSTHSVLSGPINWSVVCCRQCSPMGGFQYSSWKGYCVTKVDYAGLRTRMRYAFEEKVHELAETTRVLLGLTK